MVTFAFKNQPVVQEDWVVPDQPAVLDAGITALDVVIHLRAGTGNVLPSPIGGRVATAIIDKEIIAFTDNAADTLTGVTRGFGGTQQAAHGAGRQVRNIIPAEFLNLTVLTDDPRLADARTPVIHGLTHHNGASDALSLLDLAGDLTQVRSHDSADTNDLLGIHHTIGGGSGNVVAGNDARLNDARTPTAHAATHNSGGSDALAVDSLAATGSLRTLGTGATQAAAGNDARFTDARTPTAHAASHNAGGTDALAIDAIAATGSLRTLGTGAQQAAAGNDARLSDARTPVAHAASHNAGGTDALAIDTVATTASLRTLGTAGTQAAAGNDTRFTDARTPLAHAASHNAGGTDALAIDAVAGTGSLRTLGTGAQQAAAGSHSHVTFAGLTLTSPLLLPDGSLTVPALSFANEPTSGLYRNGSGDYVFVANGATTFRVQGGNGIAVASDVSMSWGSSGTSARDLFLYRDVAGALALRNGVNAQSHRVYNTFTDTLNYERAIFGWQQTTNALTVGTTQAGTGVARPLYLMTGGVNRWQVDTSGNLLPATDASYTIGANSANRVASLWLANSDFTTGINIRGTTTNSVISPNLTFEDNQTAATRRMHIRKDGNLQLSIIDHGGAAVLALIGQAAAGWNQIAITNALTGGSPTIAATGGDTNINLALNTKGTGVLTSNSTMRTADGTVTAPAYSFTGTTNTGMYRNAAGSLELVIAGAAYMRVAGGAIILDSGSALNWGSSGLSTSDVGLVRDGVGIIAQRSGTTAQLLNVYNTYTDSLNYERTRLGWVGNQFVLWTGQAGTGVARVMSVGTTGAAELWFQTNNNGRWKVDTNGHLLAVTDNTYDIGASGANRPRNFYLALNMFAGNNIQASNFFAQDLINSFTKDANGGGKLVMSRGTAAAGSPGANNAVLYFRDGTTAGTLKLVVRAGAAGAETTILDNIPQ